MDCYQHAFARNAMDGFFGSSTETFRFACRTTSRAASIRIDDPRFRIADVYNMQLSRRAPQRFSNLV